MYWKIGPVDPRGSFSYKIAKHPDNVFEREAGSGRKVSASFSKSTLDDKDVLFYNGYIENTPLSFLRTARKLNMQNYVHTQLSAVCPHNLKGFDICFRSVLRGNSAGGITDEVFNEKVIMDMEIGPYPVPIQQIEYWFNDAGFDVTKKETNTFSSCIKIRNKEPISVTEYLQKVYMISYFMTIKHELVRIKDDMIDKFVKLCEYWINKLEKRNRLINGLCRYNKKNIEKFEVELTELNDEINEDEKNERLCEIEKFIKKKGVHALRHDLIVKEIPEDAKTFLELGCGGGKLLRYTRKVREDIDIIGIEISTWLCGKAKRYKYNKPMTIINSNVLYPKIDKHNLLPDFLALTEVIEHLNHSERAQLVRLIKSFYIPKKFVLTVPNIEYNQFFDDMADGKLRHPDHKIEYDLKSLLEEIVEPLVKDYDISFIPFQCKDGIGISWVLVGEHRKPNKRRIYTPTFDKIQSMYNPVYLPISDYEVRNKEMMGGYSSRAYVSNNQNIFYMGATIPPVEFNTDEPEFLEHPHDAFVYYSKRGLTDIWGEEKYMGSRAYVLAFKDKDTANKMGYKSQLVINSRGGFPFFFEDELNPYKDILEDIQNNISSRLSTIEKDFIILDCEIMPWTIKAKKLITEQFRIPGECAFLSRKYGSYGNLNAVVDYINELDVYDNEDEEFMMRMFNVVAIGSTHDKKRGSKIYKESLGNLCNKAWHYDQMSQLESDHCKCVEHHKVDLSSKKSTDDSIKKWLKFCENGEGFVYKIDYPTTYTPNGYLLQPMLKVRGKQYLQLIYGIDYLEEDYFRQVCLRGVKRKRLMAIQQHELVSYLTMSWLNQNDIQTRRLIAAFIGMDNVNMQTVDATL